MFISFQELGILDEHEISEDEIMNIDTGYKSVNSDEKYPWRVPFDGEGGSTLFILKSNPTESQSSCTRGSRGFKVRIIIIFLLLNSMPCIKNIF